MEFITLQDTLEKTRDPLVEGVVETIRDKSPILAEIPFGTESTTQHKSRRELDLPKVDFRPFNKPHVPSKATFSKDVIQMKPFGGTYTLDTELMEVPTEFEGNEIAIQLRRLAKATSFGVKRNMFLGDSKANPKEVDGVKKIIEIIEPMDDVTAPGLAKQQINLAYGDAPAGQKVDSAVQLVENMNRFIDSLAEVPTRLYTDILLLHQFHALLLTAAQNNALAGIFSMTTIDVAGKKVRAGLWDGIPILPLDKDGEKNKILDFNEKSPDNSKSDCISMYAFVFGEDQFTGLQRSATGPVVRQFEDKDGMHWKLDWTIGFAADDHESLGRMRGFRKRNAP